MERTSPELSDGCMNIGLCKSAAVMPSPRRRSPVLSPVGVAMEADQELLQGLRKEDQMVEL